MIISDNHSNKQLADANQDVVFYPSPLIVQKLLIRPVLVPLCSSDFNTSYKIFPFLLGSFASEKI